MLWQTRTTHKNEDECKKAIRWCEEVRVFPTFLSPFRTFTTTYLMFLGAAWFSNIRQSTFLQYWTLCYTYVPHQTNYFNKSSNYHIFSKWQFEFHSERSGSNATIDTSHWYQVGVCLYPIISHFGIYLPAQVCCKGPEFRPTQGST